MDPVPASAIGASAVHPIELVAAYTAFANNGAVVQPRFITRIDDLAGRAVYDASAVDAAAGARSARRVHHARHDARRRRAGQRHAARKAVPDDDSRRRQDGNDERQRRRLVRRHDARARRRRLARLRQAEDDHVGRRRRLLAAPIWGQMIGRYYAGRSTSGWGPPPDGLVYAELDRDTADARDADDAARQALHRVLPAGHGAAASCATIRGRCRSGVRFVHAAARTPRTLSEISSGVDI